MKHARSIIACLVTGAALTLGACAGSTGTAVDEGVEKDRSFSYDSLRARGILVAGVHSQVIVIGRDEREDIGTTLAGQLRDKLPSEKQPQIFTPAQIVQRLGKEEYIAIMRRSDVDGMMSADDIGAVTRDLRTPPFVLCAQLIDERVNDQSSTEWQSKDKGGEYVTTYNVRYFLRVEFQLYDAFARKMVWKNTVSDEVERTKEQSEGSSCIGSCISQGLTKLLFGNPAEVTREEAIENIIALAARNLARAKAE